jgi:hypothetical protein
VDVLVLVPQRRRRVATGIGAILVFLVLPVHSLPERLAIGTAYAPDPAGLGLL